MSSLFTDAIRFWLQISTASSDARTYINHLSTENRFKFSSTTHDTPAYLVFLDTAKLNADDAMLTIKHATYPLSNCSLWHMAAVACCCSSTHIYINLDLLTIDPHAQDWGDFKIKPEQVEVQREALTHSALFGPRVGSVIQVPKTEMTDFLSVLRSHHLIQRSTVIGKTWGTAPEGEAQLDVYRDAKKQLSIAAQLLLNPEEVAQN